MSRAPPNRPGGLFHALALLYQAQGELTGAEPLFVRAVAILEKAFGWRHRETAQVRRDYAELLGALNRVLEASQHEARWQGVLPVRWAMVPQTAPYQPMEKAAPRPEGARLRLANALILLSRERQRALRSHFSHGRLVLANRSDRMLGCFRPKVVPVKV